MDSSYSLTKKKVWIGNNQTSTKTCEIEIGQKVFLFRGNAVVQVTAQSKNPAIVRTLLLLHNRHTSHSGTNQQKSAKNQVRKFVKLTDHTNAYNSLTNFDYIKLMLLPETEIM